MYMLLVEQKQASNGSPTIMCMLNNYFFTGMTFTNSTTLLPDRDDAAVP
jgi:hypothetical protein